MSLFQNEKFVVFTDRSPAAKHHFLVIPKVNLFLFFDRNNICGGNWHMAAELSRGLGLCEWKRWCTVQMFVSDLHKRYPVNEQE